MRMTLCIFGLLSISLIEVDIASFICRFNEFAGGLFIVNIAIPSSSLMVVRTNPSELYVDEKEERRC